VNFVLDKKFTGVKFDVNGGLSDYHDGGSYKIGVAAGHDLFDGRGHFEASYQHFHQDPVRNFDRPYGPGVYVLTGSGPFVATANTRRSDSTFGGLITACTSPCSALHEQFVGNGVLGPYNPGAATGTTGQSAGGDGAYSVYTTAIVELKTDQLFGRFSYDLSDSTEFYLEASYAEAFSKGYHFPVKLTPNSSSKVSQASTFFKNNPFLSPAVQAALGNNGRSDLTNTFSVGQYFINPGPEGLTGARELNQTISVMTGLDGKLGDRFNWELFYTHGENRLRSNSLNNSNYQRQFAALDAVAAPDGTIKCYAATQAATAAKYAGCVPMNPFGPTALTPAAFAWFTGTTAFKMTNILEDVGGSVSGKAFEDWAGPVNVALSAEARWNKYRVDSNADPSATVDCTGLRICNPSLPLWAQPVIGDVSASDSVWEVAGEAQAPLLRDLPLVKALDLNLAARYTDYSISGSVNTWKVGLEWKLTDDFRIRATRSRDIRAPTLNDLFQPNQAAVQGFVDLHTNTSNTLFSVTTGNPDLKPEKARTYTIGAVWQPEFIRHLTASIDYYNIKMNNAIGTINPSNNAVQQLCESSGGTSPYCALFQRPLPFSNRTPANFPTEVFQQSLNTALMQVAGYDFEVDYAFDTADLIKSWDGSWTARLLANYQPLQQSIAFPGAPVIEGAIIGNSTLAAPKGRITGVLEYRLGGWGVTVQDNWWSGYDQAISSRQVWATPHIGSFNTVDLTVQHDFKLSGADMTAYLTVQNLFYALPPIVPQSGSVGLFYPVPPGEDVMGRYFTIGVRGKL
jgi:outer membrane receptor protein involved in Fe transport